MCRKPKFKRANEAFSPQLFQYEDEHCRVDRWLYGGLLWSSNRYWCIPVFQLISFPRIGAPLHKIFHELHFGLEVELSMDKRFKLFKKQSIFLHFLCKLAISLSGMVSSLEISHSVLSYNIHLTYLLLHQCLLLFINEFFNMDFFLLYLDYHS